MRINNSCNCYTNTRLSLCPLCISIHHKKSSEDRLGPRNVVFGFYSSIDRILSYLDLVQLVYIKILFRQI